jgi:hypothetical protein
MAAPNKEGLDYFPVNVDIMHNDKIELIESKYGNKGFALVIKLWSLIYKKGYFYKWSEEERLLFAKRSGEKGGLVDEVVKESVKRGIFEEELFNKFAILTSHKIQKTYFEACKRRDKVEVVQDFILVDTSVYKNLVNVNINEVNVNINSQSKVKKSKVNNNIYNRGAPPKNFGGVDSEPVIENLHFFQKYILDNCPRIQTMHKQLNVVDAVELEAKYGRDKVLKKIDALENRTDIQKHFYVGRTLKIWLDQDKTKGDKNDNSQSTKQAPVGKKEQSKFDLQRSKEIIRETIRNRDSSF